MSDHTKMAVDLLIVGADIVCLDEKGTVILNGAIAIKSNIIHQFKISFKYK